MNASVLSNEAITLFKKLASDPVKASVLLQDDACIGGLIMVLSNENAAIVISALETLMLLGNKVEHRPRLREFIGMYEQVNLLKKSCLKHVQNLATDLWNLLNSEKVNIQQTPLQERPQNRATPRHARPSSKKAGKSFFLGGKSKTIVLQIDGLSDKNDMEICRNHLLSVRGVISITFDLHLKRSILRAREDLHTESLIQAISKTGTMSAQQVIRNEAGKEILLSFGQQPAGMNKENDHLPPYLSDDSPVKDDKALARTGCDDESVSGMFNKVTNFFAKSFYW